MANDKLQELFELKTELVTQLRELGDRQSEWGPEDRANWDQIDSRITDTSAEIDTIEQERMISSRLAEVAEADDQRQYNRRSEYGQQRSNRLRRNVTEEMRATALQAMFYRALGKTLTGRQEESLHCTGMTKTLPSDFEIRMPTGSNSGYDCWSTNRGNSRHMDKLNADLSYRAEADALDTVTDTEGLDWVPTEQFRAELIRIMVAYGPIRGVCRTIVTSGGETMRLPTVDDTANLAAIVVEEGPAVLAAPTTADVSWGAYKYGSLVKYSQEILQDSPLNMATLLAQLLGERIGRHQSNDFTVGTGSSQPNGIVTGATGATAEWDITPAATYSNADNLIDFQAELDPAYEAAGNVGWMFSRATLAEIRKIKATDGQYIWQPALRAGEQDMLLGAPYVVNQEVASVGASATAFVYGDMNSYIIRDVAGMRTRILSELYAVNDQFGIVSWMRSDGNVANAAAILTMACSAT